MNALIQLMRPKQWLKNIFVLAPLLFSLKFNDSLALKNALLAMLAFILASGTVYIINDILDRQEDRNHPQKKYRPLAANSISITSALIFSTLLFLSAAGLLFFLPLKCSYILAAYVGLNLVYSLGAKSVAILDVMIIALGFVLRVEMGSSAIFVTSSNWIILATFLLALFLGFGKRRYELGLQSLKRKSLESYNTELLDKLINVSCASALLSYAIYAVETSERIGLPGFVYTTIFVAFGLFRYLQFLYLNKQGGSPEHILYSDLPFIGNIVLWLAVTIGILAL